MTLQLPPIKDIPKAFRDAFKMTWTPPAPVVEHPVRVTPGDPIIYLEITRGHIANGERGHPERCAAALALGELIGPEYGYTVSGGGVCIWRRGERFFTEIAYSGGMELRAFVRAFDLGGIPEYHFQPAKPTTLVLRRISSTTI